MIPIYFLGEEHLYVHIYIYIYIIMIILWCIYPSCFSPYRTVLKTFDGHIRNIAMYEYIYIYIIINIYIYYIYICTFLFVLHDVPHWWLTYTLHRSMNSSCEGRHCHAMPGGVEEWRSAHGLLWPADQGEIHPLSSGDSAIMAMKSCCHDGDHRFFGGDDDGNDEVRPFGDPQICWAELVQVGIFFL